MTTVGIWLALIGGALAVLQAVWVFASIGSRRARLLRDKAQSEEREARLAEVKDRLRVGWGKHAADASNYRQMREYQPGPEIDRLLDERDELRSVSASAGWRLTWGSIDEAAPKALDLKLTEADWHTLKTQGTVGLLGGVMALVGGVLTALGSS